jgi:pyruvate/2-oxoglutarate/acetoin dehydrogenase E1 component/TPP-dependent pyruvate/acetoin dehydrogenase alpha subunit
MLERLSASCYHAERTIDMANAEDLDPRWADLGEEPVELARLYRLMITIRRCEETVARLFNEGLVHGTAHLSIGQEAVPAGVCAALEDTDFLTTTYRGHGWALAKGVSLVDFFAELFGRETGVCRGRGGSMHLCDMRVGLIGASGIVGGGLPAAVGSAYASQVLKTNAVSVASFGDGATNIGTFHESVNLAAVWGLPVVFVCENNLYGEFTPARETCRLDDLADRAKAYGIPGHIVDGNDVDAVRAVAGTAVDRARRGDGPSLIEAKTYRHRGHSRNDAARYRPAGELESWLARDPLLLARTALARTGGWSDEDERGLIAEIDHEIADAVKQARGAPFPASSGLLDDVYDDSPVEAHPPAAPRPPGDQAPPSLSYREALREALAEEMRRDPKVILFGEDVAAAGGIFKVTEGLSSEFGPMRVRDTPISENALVGAAVGAAAAGLRPIVEIMFADFLANAFDQLVNHAAKLRYMSGGQLQLPIVVRCAHGGGIGFAAQHSQAATSWLLPFPGMKIVAPATPADAKLLLKAAIRDSNPVLFLEHKALYAVKGLPPAEGEALPALGTPVLRRAGRHLTIVSLAGTVPKAIAASELLAEQGVECEVIDLRGLVPLDRNPLIESLGRTGRLLVVEEEPAGGGWANMIVSDIAQRAWSKLDQAPVVLSSAPTPVPYGPTLENAFLPTVEEIVSAGQLLGGTSG